MRLDEGKVIIDNKEIYDGMDSGSFKKLFSTDVNGYINGSIERENFKSPKMIEGLLFWVKIIFKNNIISSIEIKNADSKLKNSYDNWCDDRVELKRKSHDEWLINNLGQPNERRAVLLKYIYNWGNIVSYYDPKAGDSGILITYDRNDVDV